jgi:energy-coupling factor transporter ATP-binding protein EcfA2
MNSQKSRSIRRISVTKLFGMYNYDLYVPDASAGSEKIFILYGDNGSGKTSILKIAFHLLAPEDQSGHKSEVAPIPFKRFEIELHNNTLIWAERSKGNLTGGFMMGVKVKGRKERTVEFVAVEENSIRATSKKHDAQIKAFLTYLGKLDISLYLLSDDRTIRLAGREDRDSLYDIEYGEEWIYMEAESRARIRRRHQINPEQISQHRLAQSISRAEVWIRSKAIQGSSIGESNVNTLYSEILRRIISLPKVTKIAEKDTKKKIDERLSKLETECKQYSQYGLLPKFSGREIMKAVSSAPPGQIEIITNVLNPYLESLEKKLEALTEVYTRVNSLVSIINRFLTNKLFSYDLHRGIAISSDDGTSLSPFMLSSGERHLLLLFCNSFVAVDRPSILMIDEPELSLNIKWQRKLIVSLLDCIGDSPVQYLLATHSMELLAQHRDRVAKLESSNKSYQR